MLTLKESIIRSNSAGLDWISSHYNEFKLNYVSYEKDSISMDLQSYMLDTFFDVNKVEKYSGKFLKTYNSISNVNKDVVKESDKFFKQLSNILYNCDFDEDKIKEKLKGLIRQGIEISIDGAPMKSGNVYYYIFDNKKNNEFVVLVYRARK